MPKGYWVARVDIRNQADYDAYRARNGKIIASFGGRFIVRGGQAETGFGGARKHNVVVEFESYEKAHACFHSADYQDAAKALKRGCDVDLVIVEGYDGPTG